MASQGVTANSRLAEMQMKFQKKQMLEREQKKLTLTTGDIPNTTKSTTGNGKVRQMFDDRRRSVGIDRSHLLRPIVTSTTSKIVTTKPTMQSKSNTRINLNNNYSLANGNNNNNVFQHNFDEVDNIDNETFPKEFSSLNINNTKAMGSYVTNDTDIKNNNNNNNNKEESSILGGTIVIHKRTTTDKTNGIKLNPVITKKPNTTATSSSSKVSTISKTTTSSIKSPLPKATTSSTTKTMKAVASKTNNSKPATFILSVKPPPRVSTPPPGMASCQICQRHFSEERLAKHEEVCRKMISKKRKIFDASKHRVKGTEAEKYLKKPKGFSSTTSKSVTAEIHAGGKKSNWRKKHEDFIAAIREAKKVQEHLAKGGKLSDLPPPPPSDNSEYIQCPHCSRRFNESAAERHIPKCANMQHNKPKPIKKRL